MDYEFDFGWLFGGLAIALIGGLIVIFYRQISDNLANGVSSYERVKWFGLITIIVGLICATNLHVFVFDWIAHLLIRK